MSTTARRSSSDAGCEKPASLHDSARGSPEPPSLALDGFHSLVNEINDILGPSNGIDSAGIDVEELKRAMSAYGSDEAEWERYAFGDKSRAYTRNLIDNCNGKSNLVSLTGVQLKCGDGLLKKGFQHAFLEHAICAVFDSLLVPASELIRPHQILMTPFAHPPKTPITSTNKLHQFINSIANHHDTRSSSSYGHRARAPQSTTMPTHTVS